VKLIERTAYLTELTDFFQTPDIKVITGIRRSGKSELMDALESFLQEHDPNAKYHPHQLQSHRF